MTGGFRSPPSTVPIAHWNDRSRSQQQSAGPTAWIDPAAFLFLVFARTEPSDRVSFFGLPVHEPSPEDKLGVAARSSGDPGSGDICFFSPFFHFFSIFSGYSLPWMTHCWWFFC